MIRGIMFTMALAAIASTVNAATLELLGRPCRAKNILATCIVKDRATGREMFVLSDMNENSHAELLFVDFENNTGRAYRAPAGAGAWALKEVPGDRLIVGTFYDGVFMVFDLKKMEFVKVANFPGETYIWNLAMGGDGRVYGGTYPGGKLGALDLNDYTVEDCGAPAPPNLYCRQVSELPDGRILCYFNTEKPTALTFDPAKKKFDPAPPAISNGVQGAVFDGYFVTGRQVFDGKTLEEVRPIPFPTPPAEKGRWSFNAHMTTRDTVYMQQGQALYRYKAGDKDMTLVCDVDTFRSGIDEVSADGWALGVRGQDYFVVKPGAKAAELRPIPVESGPRQTLFLRVAPDGRLWGGPTFGQTLWWMDPHTKKYVNTSTICDSGGEVYDVAFANGKVYAVAYAGGDIVEYDPSQPWNQIGLANPRVIKHLATNGYIRPEAGVTTGPDGKLYAGWLTRYGAYGGAVSITDPQTGDTELIENPLGEQAVVGVATDGKYVYVGTSLTGNGLPQKKGEWARFGMIDLATKKVVFQREFEGCASVRILGCDPESRRVALSAAGKPMLFDTVVRGFVAELDGAAQVGGRSVALPGDGSVIYGSGSTVVRLDMRTGRTTILLQAPSKVDNVAAGPDGRLYISCGVNVYAVKSE